MRAPSPRPSPAAGEGGMKASKRNDARTELTTSFRRSVAGWGQNDEAKSMTHPTDGTCGSKGPWPRRGVHDCIRDGANRIDARGPLSCAAAAGRLPQQTHRADISGANLAQTLALFLQKSFQVFGWPRIGD